MDIKAVVLDFDGVIIESVGIKDEAFRFLFEGYPDKINEIMDYHRSHNAAIRFDKFRLITENILKQPFSDRTAEELKTRFSRFVLDKVITCPFVVGAMDLLRFYQNRCSLYLASINPEEELAEILRMRGLTKFFKKVYAHPWHKAEAIREIMRMEEAAPGQIVFIGDSFEDYQAAAEVKVRFIGRDSGRPFHNAGIFVGRDLREILEHLKSPAVRLNH